MAELTGKDLYIAWQTSAGTFVLSTDYRTMSTNPTIGLADFTAGSDADRTYGVTVKDGTYDWSGLYQAAGTALVSALDPGTGGTLTISPEGTASGKPKQTFPAIAMGAKMNYQYDNVIEVTCSFQKNGAITNSSN